MNYAQRDLFGIIIAITGAITVVLASNASDVRLDPDALILAISQTPFIIFSAIYVTGAIILATLSHTSIGRQWVFVDVGLCALFGSPSFPGHMDSWLTIFSRGFYCLVDQGDLNTTDHGMDRYVYEMDHLPNTCGGLRLMLLVLTAEFCTGPYLHWCWPNQISQSSFNAI